MLIEEASPPRPRDYKQREDLLDAVICAWTAAYWHRHGLARCQVLGVPDAVEPDSKIGAIIAPARTEQRPHGLSESNPGER